jgi:uncharacterized membrane protein (UPF0127 family)
MAAMAPRTWTALASLLAVAACEPRVEEPSPPPSRASANSAVVASGGPVPASADPLAGRCVRPLPAQPARPKPSPAASCPPDPTGRPDLRVAKVRIPAAGAEVRVEVAQRDEHRMRGLMYRTSMAPDQGMLFIFEQRQPLRFWMRNTCLPLDMLFIDQDGLIVGIEENVPTLNDNGYQVGCPGQYVLEVNAGWSRTHGVKPGQFVQIEGL